MASGPFIAPDPAHNLPDWTTDGQVAQLGWGGDTPSNIQFAAIAARAGKGRLIEPAIAQNLQEICSPIVNLPVASGAAHRDQHAHQGGLCKTLRAKGIGGWV
jgi:hypothetical protein